MFSVTLTSNSAEAGVVREFVESVRSRPEIGQQSIAVFWKSRFADTILRNSVSALATNPPLQNS